MNQSDFGRSISRCAVAVAVLLGFTAMQALGQEQIYSKGWMTDMLNSGESGSCSPMSRVYEWRNVGWGSNINREFQGRMWSKDELSARRSFALELSLYRAAVNAFCGDKFARNCQRKLYGGRHTTHCFIACQSDTPPIMCSVESCYCSSTA